MSILNSRSAVVDPHNLALAQREQALAALATAQTRAANGTAQREARTHEVEAWPHLSDESQWKASNSPASDAGFIEVTEAKERAVAADVEVDRTEPRIQALRDRIRSTCAQLADAGKNPRIAAIRTHANALKELGVDVGDVASTAAQREIGDEFGRIADELKALRADRQRDHMPQAHLFSVERAEGCRPLRNLGVNPSMPVLDGLRQAAYANALTAETLDATCELLGTPPAPPSWGSTPRGYEIKQRRAHWEERQRTKAKHLDDQRLGLRY